MRFGRLIGAGQAGFVFQNMDNPKHFYKLVALPSHPLSTYPIRSLDRKLFAVNSQQAILFQRLAESGNQPPSLPKVYSFVQGTIDPSLRRQLITSAEDFDWEDELTYLLREFRTGQPYAIWEMEAIPCTDANDYCQRFDGTKLSPLDNSDYQELLRWLLSQGFVVRDIRNPENFGFRENGSQVFFDPVIAPWPVNDSDPESRAAFTGTFGNDLVTVQRALDSGDYFNWYHGQAIMQSEEELQPKITTFAELQKFWNDHDLYAEEDQLEQLIQWESEPTDISKHPESLNTLNWTGNREQDWKDVGAKTNKLLGDIWEAFVGIWNYEFGEIFYATGNEERRWNSGPVSPIFEVLQESFTLDEVIMPQTTLLFRIVNDPAARQELLKEFDGIQDLITEYVFKEQLKVRELLLKYGKGNPILVGAIYRWVRRYCGHQMILSNTDSEKLYGNELGYGSKVIINNMVWRWGPEGSYLRDFTSPYELIHYESLYETSSTNEAAALLTDGLAPVIEWNVYHS